MSIYAPNFGFEELTDSANHPELVSQNRVDAKQYSNNLVCTSWGLQSIRDLLGRPMATSSGYRNQKLNKAVGGSETSKHQSGKCWDGAAKGMNYKEFFEFIKTNKSKIPNLKKAIVEGVRGKEWVHLEFEDGFKGEIAFYSTTDGKTYDRVV